MVMRGERRRMMMMEDERRKRRKNSNIFKISRLRGVAI
jgi:hypothetical protein